MYWRDALSTLLSPLIAKHPLGLFTDMDGTISPIVDKPDEAKITSRNRDLLQSLFSQLALVAVVSGRAADDVRHRVDLPNLTYVGNHGLERWVNGEMVLAPAVAQYRPQIELALHDLQEHRLPGMMIEDKGATLSVHYRQTDNPQTVATQFRPVVKSVVRKHELRLFEGRMIFELRPPVEMNKGTVLRNLINEHHLEAAVYIGDDTTDVDALRMARQLREAGDCYTIGIGVQSPDMPDSVRDAADVMVSDVADVEAFLAWLLKACSASST